MLHLGVLEAAALKRGQLGESLGTWLVDQRKGALSARAPELLHVLASLSTFWLILRDNPIVGIINKFNPAALGNLTIRPIDYDKRCFIVYLLYYRSG